MFTKLRQGENENITKEKTTFISVTDANFLQVAFSS